MTSALNKRKLDIMAIIKFSFGARWEILLLAAKVWEFFPKMHRFIRSV